MLNVYIWNARYKRGEDIIIVGAESIEDVRQIIDDSLREHGYNGGIDEIIVFKQIPHTNARERGILDVC